MDRTEAEPQGNGKGVDGKPAVLAHVFFFPSWGKVYEYITEFTYVVEYMYIHIEVFVFQTGLDRKNLCCCRSPAPNKHNTTPAERFPNTLGQRTAYKLLETTDMHVLVHNIKLQ